MSISKEFTAIIQQAKSERKSSKKFFSKLKRRVPKDLDRTMGQLHEEVFDEIDCLDCANCCSTTSPIFRDIDIQRLSIHLKIRPSEFITQYLKMDSEGDYVLQSSPCMFLDEQNYCSVYEHRPKACREYPHTNRKNFHQLLNLTVKNMEVCPATYRIVQRLKETINNK